MALSIAELDARRHDRGAFDCGVEVLDRYLTNLATQHRAKGISTTFVLVSSDKPRDILGYYSLSAATLALDQLSDADRKGLPTSPVPAVRIGRLATAIASRGHRFGELLLQDAVRRALAARGTLGVYAMVVEAKDSMAEAFCRKYGFRLCSARTRQLYLPLGHG